LSHSMRRQNTSVFTICHTSVVDAPLDCAHALAMLDQPRTQPAAQGALRIAFVGTYPPRRCGIATFTRDLAQAIGSSGQQVLPMTLAVSDPGGQYEYPDEVK